MPFLVVPPKMDKRDSIKKPSCQHSVTVFLEVYRKNRNGEKKAQQTIREIAENR